MGEWIVGCGVWVGLVVCEIADWSPLQRIKWLVLHYFGLVNLWSLWLVLA